MTRPEKSSVTPFKRMDGEPVFDEAWQAQLLAMVDQMISEGVFSNAHWSDTLGQHLKDAENEGKADDIDTYYAAVLTTFETLLAQSSNVSADSISEKQQAWERAYLSTPHGQPVMLKD